MTVVSIDDFKKQIHKTIDKVSLEHDVLHVVGGQGANFVVLSEGDWKAIEETLYLNQTPGLVASIHEAAQESPEDGVPLESVEW